MRWRFPAMAGLAGAALLATALGCGGGGEEPQAWDPGETPAASGDGGTSAADGSGAASDEPAPAAAPGPAVDVSAIPAAPKPELPAADAGYGHLLVRFAHLGAPGQRAAVSVTKDQEFCGKMPLLSEELVVDPTNWGVANVVLWLDVARGDEPPAPHASYEATAGATIPLSNEWCRFEPHITLVRTTQKLEIRNPDEVGHNTKADFLENTSFNQTIPVGQNLPPIELPNSERLPSPVACNIHPWMTGFILVKESPYMAVSGPDGHAVVASLPEGEWSFQVWHEKAGYLEKVVRDGKEAAWKKGRVDVTIKGGETTDLGVIALSPELFAK